ncbi:hypothetical protein LTR37_017668 [Vermiconidia calcicola]|uniref:Uncharacterized protein n=1 Tax=Vermiconidia calcicola TaxID=1690605 RepID=A0ACC3MK23_9PEZI|nr:hypothetical protein LTR37_017668 [Vermiconidia calcicola]
MSNPHPSRNAPYGRPAEDGYYGEYTNSGYGSNWNASNNTPAGYYSNTTYQTQRVLSYDPSYAGAAPQGYDSQQYHDSYGLMNYPQYGNAGYGSAGYGNAQYSYQQPPGYNAYAQQQQYEPTPPQIRNPFAPPPPTHSDYGAQNSGFDPEYEAQVAQWSSAYAPPDPFDKSKKGEKNVKGENPNLTAIGARQGPQAGVESAPANDKTADEKKKTVVRQGGGKTWQDDSLLEWDPTQFRIYVGNLAGEVTDDSLAKAFAQYGVAKARVIRDKRTTKSKGFGFVSFADNEMGFKAAKEMRGKYIGSHPVTIDRANTNVQPTVHKDRNKGKNKHNKGRDKGGKKEDDPLRAHTGAHIEKKPVKNPAGMKILG